MKQRIKQAFANVDQGIREPRTIGTMLRKSLVLLWRARGGGLYGLGYVITFIANEVPRVIVSFTEIVTSAESLLGAIFEWLLRVGADSFESMLHAFLWPVVFLQLLGGWGIVALVVGFVVFEKLLRPLVESVFPELRAAELEQAEETEEPKG